MFSLVAICVNTSKISKEEILSATTSMAKMHGLQKMNMRDIAKQCGVSVGTLYNYFPTKDALVIAIIEDFWHQAFTHDTIADLSLDDFFKCYHQLYALAYQHLGIFEAQWIYQLTKMDEKTIAFGKQMEANYFQRIQKMLMIMLDQDLHIHKNIWSTTFTKADFLDFLYRNTLDELKKGTENPIFLFELLKRLLL